jgi:phosphatidylglycerophosphatase A
MTRFAVFVCTFGYIGYAPFAPGTVGSAAGVVLYGLMRYAGIPPALDLAIIVVLFVAGIWSGTEAERYFGTTDPGPGVIDEVAGMLITLYLLPPTWPVMVTAFFVFRALDVFKPWPANRFERFHGGLGMMADDAMAAVYGNVIMRGLIWMAASWLL